MDQQIIISAEVESDLGMTEIKSVITTQNLEAGAVLKILGKEEFLVYDPFSPNAIRRGNTDSIGSILAEIAHKKQTWRGTIPGPIRKNAA